MSIYNRLLQLYKKDRDSNKIPLEDYTTELLVGLLEDSKEMLENFVERFIGLQGSGFKIDSQVRYSLEDDRDCIIDVVVKNDDIVCFIENKVNSGEGEGQLDRYTRVLKRINETEGKSVYLRYCTKYYDKKEKSGIDFNQYRWSDVYEFLLKYKNNKLVEEFLNYLRGEGMSSSGNFNFQDLLVFNTINSTLTKMDECLDNVRPKLTELFGKPYQYDYERLKQIRKNDRYAMWTEGVLGDNYSEVLICFEFKDVDGCITPSLVAQLYFDKNTSNWKTLRDKLIELDKFEYYDEKEAWFWFEKPLSDFLSSEKQIQAISEWFCEKLEIIKENDIPWNAKVN